MSRYQLIAAIVGSPPGYPYQKFCAGRTIADSAANAVAGDVIWPALAATPFTGMVPLDAAAAAVMAATFPNNNNVVKTVGGQGPPATGTDCVSA